MRNSTIDSCNLAMKIQTKLDKDFEPILMKYYYDNICISLGMKPKDGVTVDALREIHERLLKV